MPSKTRQEKRREQKIADRRENLRRGPKPASQSGDVAIHGNDEAAQKLRGIAKLGAQAYLISEKRELLAAYLPGEGWLKDGGNISIEKATAIASLPGVTFGMLKQIDFAKDPNIFAVREAYRKKNLH
jgi:hypothetical protein